MEKPFPNPVYERARKTLDYLFQCQVGKGGELPNYGANDGALSSPFSGAAYPDYRPQINALYYFFSRRHLYQGAGRGGCTLVEWRRQFFAMCSFLSVGKTDTFGISSRRYLSDQRG